MGLGDICYSQSGVTHNSFNESLSIADNGQTLGFRALMGFGYSNARDSLLTNEGMAEHLWKMFLTQSSNAPVKHCSNNILIWVEYLNV